MASARPIGRVIRTLIFRLVLSSVIVGIYIAVGVALPGLAGLLAVAIPAVLLLRRAKRSLPARRWALLLTAVTVAFSIVVQTGKLAGWNAGLVVVAVMGVNSRGNELAKAFVRTGAEVGYICDVDSRAVENTVHVNNLHATLLHVMGLDNSDLTYYHNGLDERLTGPAEVDVVWELLK